MAYSEHFERLICGVSHEVVAKMRQQEDSTGVSFEEREHEIIDKIQKIDWLNEKNQGILAALDQINVYIDSTNTEFYEIRMPQSDQVLELEMEDGDIQYTMQTTLDSMLQSSFSMNYQMIGSFAINDTKTPIPLTKTDNTISNELCLYELILSYTRADSARTIKPTVLPRQIPDIVNLTYYVHDHLGNTRVTYDKTGCSNRFNLQGVFDYYPYGKILREYQPNQTEKYLTTHHQRDEETTLDYRYARFYDSDLGRFLSIDPMAADYASWSGYNYVVGNPVIFIDPDGRNPDPNRVKRRRQRLDNKAERKWMNKIKKPLFEALAKLRNDSNGADLTIENITNELKTATQSLENKYGSKKWFSYYDNPTGKEYTSKNNTKGKAIMNYSIKLFEKSTKAINSNDLSENNTISFGNPNQNMEIAQFTLDGRADSDNLNIVDAKGTNAFSGNTPQGGGFNLEGEIQLNNSPYKATISPNGTSPTTSIWYFQIAIYKFNPQPMNYSGSHK